MKFLNQKPMKNLFFLIVVLSCLSCNRNKKVTTDSPKKSAGDVATAMFGDRYTLEVNKNDTYTIIKTKYKKFKDLFPELDYLIYDHEASEIIHRDTLKAGYVGWSDDFTVKAIARNLTEEGAKSVGRMVYLYDVKKRAILEIQQTSTALD